MRLLLLEDDKPLAAAARTALTQQGIACDWVRSAGEFRAAVDMQQYDCLLMDLTLPDGSGALLLAELRRSGNNTPVIVVTAQRQGESSAQLLDMGADDFVVKPFDIGDLSARIRAVTRRGRSEDGHASLQHGPLVLLLDRRLALWHGTLVPLRRKEYWLLEALMRNRNRVLSSRQLRDTLYGWGAEAESNTIEVFIHHLRRRFGSSLIHNIRGVGYRLGSEAELESFLA